MFIVKWIPYPEDIENHKSWVYVYEIYIIYIYIYIYIYICTHTLRMRQNIEREHIVK